VFISTKLRWVTTLLVLMLTGAAWVEEASPVNETKNLPKLVDLGAKSCIPCKQMAPILEELTKEYAGKFEVQFIDVAEKKNAEEAARHKIELIPTQVFFDASGKELWRHEGFLSKEAILAKWKELGFSFGENEAGAYVPFQRLEPAKKDERPKGSVCYMCEKDLAAQTMVVFQSPSGEVRFCSPHCCFILHSCLTADKNNFENKALVTDAATGVLVAAATASYVQQLADKTGRPVVYAFADKQSAAKHIQSNGGNILDWNLLQNKELATRCGFCDRAVYPEDASLVKVAGVHSWGCCSHCALGVAARTGKDIEVHQPDGLTGEMIVVKTHNGEIESITPKNATAWFGQRKSSDGQYVSAGCFHQGFFVNQANLIKWVESRPYLVGREISIAQALADKIKLTPEQIRKACKFGECKPK
jgi:thioredoxin 1